MTWFRTTRKWKHRDYRVRLKAVQTMNSQVEIEKVLQYEWVPEVLLAAAEKLTDRRRADAIYIAVATDYHLGSMATANTAISRLSDDGLAKLVRLPPIKYKTKNGRYLLDNEFARYTEKAKQVMRTAVGKITNQTLLAEIAKKASYPEVSEAAVDRLADQAVLTEIAKNAMYINARLAAVRNPNFTDKELSKKVYSEYSEIKKNLALTEKKPQCDHERNDCWKIGTCSFCGSAEMRYRCKDCGFQWNSHICT